DLARGAQQCGSVHRCEAVSHVRSLAGESDGAGSGRGDASQLRGRLSVQFATARLGIGPRVPSLSELPRNSGLVLNRSPRLSDAEGLGLLCSARGAVFGWPVADIA